MNRFITLFAFFILHWLLPSVFPSGLSAQNMQVVTSNKPPFTPENLISNILLGDGVEVTGITFNGNPIAVGYFTGGTNAIGIDRGIVLTSGRAEGIPPLLTPGNPGSDNNGLNFATYDNNSLVVDASLSAVAASASPGLSVNDVAVYTITFIPTADTLRFRYCWGSEEYPEWGCSNYNDIFGFFIAGPGITGNLPGGFRNIALIPGTNQVVSINNIHPSNPNNSSCNPVNIQYYNNNLLSNKQPVYDGFTDIFTATAIVEPCQEYVIKLAICDIGDSGFDSGVFLEAKSFGTGSLDANFATISRDGTVTEGCSDAVLTFRLPSPATEVIPIDFTIWGTAINGVDFQTLPTTLQFGVGDQEITLPIVALEDGLAEVGEFLAIDIQTDPCNRDTIYLYFRDNTMVPPVLPADTIVCIGGQPLEIDATVPVALPTAPTFTNTQDIAIPSTNVPIFSDINVFGVLPTTLGPDMIRSVCINIQHPWDDDLDIFLISPGGQFIELSTDNGVDGNDYTQTCFTPTATVPINFPGPTAPASAAPFTGNFLPEGVWSDLWDSPNTSNGTWRLQVSDDGAGFNGTLLDWAITFEPGYKIEYSWTPGAGVSCDTCPVTQLNPGQTTLYRVLATDSYGCTSEDDISVGVNLPLAAPNISCGELTPNSIEFLWTPVFGAQGYEVNVEGTGWVLSNGPFSHTVNGINPDSSITIEVRGISTDTICPALVGSATCINCSIPSVSANTTPAACFGDNSGTLTVTTNNLNGPYTFEIPGASNSTGIFQNLIGGDYTITITDASGCVATVTATVDQPEEIVVSISTDKPISCFGQADGALAATVTGGFTPYTYLWSDGTQQTTPVAGNLGAGIYHVTVTDSMGCTGVATDTLVAPADLSASIIVNNPNCPGESTGSILLTTNGGTPPIQYDWADLPATSDPGDRLALAAATYTVTITDANGCSSVLSRTLTDPAPLTGGITGGAVSCFGAADGEAIVTAQGGTGALIYAWSDPLSQKTAVATGLTSNAYRVTVSDGAGCSIILSVNIASPLPVSVSISATDPDCFMGSNGSATAMPSGGNSNFTYLWSDANSQTSETATGLNAGTYSVTATDSKGCTGQGIITVGEPEAISVNSLPKPVSCAGGQDGALDISVQGGTPPYSFAWSSGEFSEDISGKTTGLYSVQITDSKDCTFNFQDSIPNAVQLEVAFTGDSVLCFGETTGSLQALITGGSAPYQILWEGPDGFTAIDTNLLNLVAGSYIATVTDANGCTVIAPTLVEGPTAPLVLDLPTIGDTICYNATNGSATALVSGGTSPYSYFWTPGDQTAQTATGLASAFAWVTVTDRNGCVVTDSIFIPQKGEAFVFASTVEPSCYNGSNGRATITGAFYSANSVPISTFSYLWNTVPAQTGATATGLEAETTYQVTATDAQGCTAIQSFFVGNAQPMDAQIDSFRNVLCKGDSTGFARVKGIGGAPPYTYQWGSNTGNAAAALVSNLPAGTYRVSVIDSKGCQERTDIELTEPSRLNVIFTPSPVGCYGESTGKASVQPSGGTPPYEFLWENGNQTALIQDMPSGFATLNLSDANGCLLIDSVFIGQPEQPVSGIALVQNVRCFGGSDGRITIQPTGGTPPYRFNVNERPLNGSSIQIGLKAGPYIPGIVDKNGCVFYVDTVWVGQPPVFSVELGEDIYIELGRDTQLLPVVTGANEPVSYAWGGAGRPWLSCLDCQNPLVEGLESTQYFEVLAIDSFGCRAEDGIRVVIEKPRIIHVPTAFSPNGDSANDILLVHGQNTANVITFRVFDRWGELVYEGGNFQVNDPVMGWNGSFRGKEMDPGVYIWVLEVEFLDGVREIYKGNTTLIR